MNADMIMKYNVDLNVPLVPRMANTLFVSGDNMANTIEAVLTKDGEALDASGYTCVLKMTRPDGEVPEMAGQVDGNVLTVTMTSDFYAVPGHYTAKIKLINAQTGERKTVLVLYGEILDDGGTPTIIPGNKLPEDIEAMLAMMEELREATADSRTAAQEARDAAETANQAAKDIDDKVAEANEELTGKVGQLSEEIESEFAPRVFTMETAGKESIGYKVIAGNKYTVSRIERDSDAGKCELRVYDDAGNKIDTVYLNAGQTLSFIPTVSGDVEIFIPSTAVLPQVFEIANNSSVSYRLKMLTDNAYREIGVKDFDWVYGSIDSNGKPLTKTTRIRTERLKVNAGVSIALKESGYKFGAYLFADATTSALLESRSMNVGAYTTTQAGYLALCCGASEEAEITELPSHYAESVLDVSGTTADTQADQKLDALGYLSKYDRTGKIYFGSVPDAWYKCDSVQHQFNRNSTAEEVLAAFHDLADASNGYITETVIGATNDGTYNIMMYDLNPVKQSTPGGMVNRDCPTIIVTTCHHGEEKIPCYGWLETIDNLVNRPWASDVLSYIRANVRVLYIPIVNPSGFDAYTRTNSNGVDLNRNYSEGWSEDGESGAEPFDQGETTAVENIIQRHPEAVLLLDNHGYGSSAVTDALNVNWISLYASIDPVHTKLCAAMRAYNARQTFLFAHDYGFTFEETIGKITANATGGTIKTYANACGIPAINCEGSNGFQDVTAYSEDAKRYNSEISVNVIMACLSALAQ